MSGDADDPLEQVTGFDWDGGNATKIVARHSVEPAECEQVFFVEPLIVVVDDGHSQSEQPWRALGRTANDRLLHLVFTIRGELIRVIHARDMNRKERLKYEQAKARFEEDSEF